MHKCTYHDFDEGYGQVESEGMITIIGLMMMRQIQISHRTTSVYGGVGQKEL